MTRAVLRAHAGGHELRVAERLQQLMGGNLDPSFDIPKTVTIRKRVGISRRSDSSRIGLSSLKSAITRSGRFTSSRLPTAAGTRFSHVRYIGYPFNRSFHARIRRPDTQRMARNSGSRSPDWIVATASQACPRARSAPSKACMSC